MDFAEVVVTFRPVGRLTNGARRDDADFESLGEFRNSLDCVIKCVKSFVLDLKWTNSEESGD